MARAGGNAAGTDYGVDAPNVMRNFFVIGFACMIAAAVLPKQVPIWPTPRITLASRSLFWPAGFLIGEGFLFLPYVKLGKFRHRDFMLSLHTWRGDESVLDVGCGRGLLLVGAAKRLTTGHATGIDIWSKEDMAGNSAEAATRNLQLEGVAGRCTLVSVPAQEMPFASESFDVIVTNLCLHNIYDTSTRSKALGETVRVLRPGGLALISDYKFTRDYAKAFRDAGLSVSSKHGSFLTAFPPLKVVIAHKPSSKGH